MVRRSPWGWATGRYWLLRPGHRPRCLPRSVLTLGIVQPKTGRRDRKRPYNPRLWVVWHFRRRFVARIRAGLGRIAELLTDWPPITIWDVAAAQEVRRFGGHPYQIFTLAFPPTANGLLRRGAKPWHGLGCRDLPRGGITGWDITKGSSRWPFRRRWEVFTKGNDDGPTNHGTRPMASRSRRCRCRRTILTRLFLSDGRMLAIVASEGPNQGLNLWDIAGHKELRRFKQRTGLCTGFFPGQPDARVGQRPGYDVATGRRIDGLKESKSIIACV